MRRLRGDTHIMSRSDFWLSDWLDSREVVNWEDATKLLKEPKQRKSLLEQASEVPYTTEPIPITGGPSHDDHLHYTFNHPDFEHTVWGVIESNATKSGSESAIRHATAESVHRRYLAALVSDIQTAQNLNSSLASTINFHGLLLKGLNGEKTAEDVAFQLDLPVLNGLSPEMLLKIRVERSRSQQNAWMILI